MNYSDKVSTFLELSGLDFESLEPHQKVKLKNLRRRLSALGLDPQQPKGLTYRALVYDNRKKVKEFLYLSSQKKGTKGLGWQLKSLGIDINKPQQLRLLLNTFSTCAKEIDRKKDVDRINPARAEADAQWAAVDAEIAAAEEEAEDSEVALEAVETANQFAFGT